jgi:indolepyruvate ferredoxin oxidoreductase beta subunit
MMAEKLGKDPYNIIITGVGGQGNVTASRVLGNMLVPLYTVTIGETFGASQRGGSVVSHMRVSAKSVWSPQILLGTADLIVALEPVEALRVMNYSNKDTYIIVNSRPVYPVGVITGELEYPPLEDIKKALLNITDRVWFLNATDEALEHVGNPILGNMIMLGAVTGLGLLPVGEEEFISAISKVFPRDKIQKNVEAFRIGAEIVTKS